MSNCRERRLSLCRPGGENLKDLILFYVTWIWTQSLCQASGHLPNDSLVREGMIQFLFDLSINHLSINLSSIFPVQVFQCWPHYWAVLIFISLQSCLHEVSLFWIKKQPQWIIGEHIFPVPALPSGPSRFSPFWVCLRTWCLFLKSFLLVFAHKLAVLVPVGFMALEVFLSLVTIDTLVLNQYYVKEKN